MGDEKKIIVLLCTLLITLPLLGSASTIPEQEEPQSITIYEQPKDDHTIVMMYSFHQPEIHNIIMDQTQYQTITMDDTICYGNPGEPVLPVKGAHLLIPYETGIDEITVILGEKKFIGNNIIIQPGQTPVSDMSAEKISFSTPNAEIYSSAEPFPDTQYLYNGIQKFRGMPIAIISLYPVEYIPVSGTLSYYSEITVKITTVDTHQSDVLFRGLKSDIKEVETKVDNLEGVPIYPESIPCFGMSILYDLLIITTDDLKSGFNRLAAAHNRQGVRTAIRTLGTDIPVDEDVNVTCTNIRDYIREQYLNWDIEYVLIGGDIDHIPAIYLYVDIMGRVSDFIPSDMYYACLDGPFNSGGNLSRWGEPWDGENGSDIDLFAEVNVGRACVGNLTEVGYFVNKTLAYMNRQYEVNYLHEIVLVGEMLWNNPLIFGGNYMDQLIDGNYPLNGIPSDEYNISTLYDRDWPGFNPEDPHHTGWPSQILIDRINQGVHIINHAGHATQGNTMRLFTGGDLYNINLLNNDNVFFAYSWGCLSGAFDMNCTFTFTAGGTQTINDSIAEFLTVKLEHGAFAGIWNTREGWFSRTGTGGDSQDFNLQFWDAVFGEKITVISQANQDSKEDLAHLIPHSIYKRCCYYELTYFGDPSLAFILPAPHLQALGPFEGVINEPVQFTSSIMGGTPPYRFQWFFGDGTILKGQNAIHIYNKTGNYNITVTVTDRSGNTDMDTTIATIYAPAVWIDDNYSNTTPGWNNDHFANIQRGIDTLNIGGTVFVYNGTYAENLTIEKSMNLIGLGDKERTIIDGKRNLSVIKIFAENVTVTGFTIQNSSMETSYGHGIKITGITNNIIIRNNIIKNNKIGIDVDQETHQFIFSDNSITENTEHGISLSGWDEGFYTISNNQIYLNGRYGMMLYNFKNSCIVNNTIIFNGRDGICLASSTNTSISGNTINSNSRYGLYLSESNNNTVCNNSITANTEYGLYIRQPSHYNNIYHNNFINTRNVYTQTSCQNIWDNGPLVGGNYWNNWPCTGNPSQGQPYIINTNNIDHYPFQDPNGWE